MISTVKKILSAPGLYFVFMRIKPFTGKNFFLLICIAGLIWYTLYTRSIIGKLQDEAIAVTQTYAELIRAAISEHMNYEEMNVIFEDIIQKSNNPIIITDTSWSPILWKNVSVGTFFTKRVLSSHDRTAQTVDYLSKKIHEYKLSYDPKPLYISESGVKIGYLVFGNSPLLDSLAMMPFLEVGLIAAFIIFAYIAFHNIRVTERSNLWVGLAKETAHQLGTPISSLMGWIEYLRAADDEEMTIPPEVVIGQIKKICDDMDNDIKRLKKVTSRFSQIGSIPALLECDINEALQDCMEYYRVRLPLLRKKIEIFPLLGDIPAVYANRDLLEWVFENLMKNAIDAIQRDDGKIEIKTEYIEVDKIVRIYHTDNGKGISWEAQKKIFAPGYTTKKRGWGLGLTLAKRIVEDYHNGKIYVNWSQKDKGTVFCIDLPIAQQGRKKTVPRFDRA